MTTLMMVDSRPGETRDQAISRRFRQELAGIGLSANKAAKVIGVSQSWISRHLTGETDWKANEVDQVCGPLGLDAVFLLTGILAIPDATPSVNRFRDTSGTVLTRE
ncbi:helix-turn-helix domain-containing protein [Mycobacteroides chelonae]|uniref:helix-turn-helix domain-containing protein n=1 Tax=Mycobacteroides chelonae TaxID=1774 RepID=UPI0038768A91